MITFVNQTISKGKRNRPSNNIREGMVYSTDTGICLFRGGGKNDLLIAPIGYSDLCYHIGNGAPCGALFDVNGLDSSGIRNPGYGVFNTLTNELVSIPENSIQVLCSSKGELFDAGISGDPGNGYTIHFRNTFTERDLLEENDLQEQVTAMCSHEGELYYGTFDGEIRKGKKIIAKREGLISGLTSVRGVLYDGLCLYGEKRRGEIRETLTGKMIRKRKTTSVRSPTLISFNDILLDLNYTGSKYELRETFSNREIPISTPSKRKMSIHAVCSIGPDLVNKILEKAA